jgi:hypothetical protein
MVVPVKERENFLEDGRTIKLEKDEDDQFLYWADDDSDKVIEEIEGRREKQRRENHGDSIFNKIRRSLSYYYGFYDYISDLGDTAIQVTGEYGQVLSFTTNYYRYLLRQLLTLISNDIPDYSVNPANIDNASRIQARLGRRVLDFYLQHRDVEIRLRDALEDALVSGIGFLKVAWDEDLGEAIDADEENQKLIHEGDITVELIDLEDLIWDFDKHSRWEDLNWIVVKTRKNKFDLMARFPDKKSKIFSVGVEDDDDLEPEESVDQDDPDNITVWEFHHKPTDALPNGRLLLYLSDNTKLSDTDSPYRRLPIYPIRLGKVRKTLLGWSPAFDIQQQQELLNELLAKVATIYDNLGYPLVWAPPAGKAPDPQNWIGNIAWVTSDTKPELVNLVEIPEDIFRMIDLLLRNMDTVVGINSVMRGEAEGSVRANRMQVFIDDQTRRFNTELEASYNSLFEDVGVAILEILQDFPETGRVRTLVGKQDGDSLISFTPEDLFSVTSIQVKRGNPLMKTVQGRLETLGVLQQSGIQLPKEEMVSILEGAPLNAITKTIEGQVDFANAAVENLMDGGQDLPLATDNQLLMMKKFASILNSPTMREDPELTENVLSAIMSRWQLYNDPAIFELQLAFGYAEIPPLAGQREAQAQAPQPQSPQGPQQPPPGVQTEPAPEQALTV